jgi:hypothetical protein
VLFRVVADKRDCLDRSGSVADCTVLLVSAQDLTVVRPGGRVVAFGAASFTNRSLWNLPGFVPENYLSK